MSTINSSLFLNAARLILNSCAILLVPKKTSSTDQLVKIKIKNPVHSFKNRKFVKL